MAASLRTAPECSLYGLSDNTVDYKAFFLYDLNKSDNFDFQGIIIQKEEVDIDGEKSAQISIVAKKTVTQRWLQIMVMGPVQAMHYNYLVVFSLLCSYYVTDMIKKTGIAVYW